MSWPVLSSKFFTDHPPTAILYRLWSNQFPWSESLLPVYEWNGLLYVAAKEPDAVHANLGEWPPNWVLVKADEADLKRTWDSWHAEEKPETIDTLEALAKLSPQPVQPTPLTFSTPKPEIPSAPLEMPAAKMPEQKPTLPESKPLMLEQDLPGTEAHMTVVPPAPPKGEFSPDDLFQSLGVSGEITPPQVEGDDDIKVPTPAEDNQLLEGLLPDAPPPPPQKVVSLQVLQPLDENTPPPTVLPPVPDDTNPPMSLEKLKEIPLVPGKPPAKGKSTPAPEFTMTSPPTESETAAATSAGVRLGKPKSQPTHAAYAQALASAANLIPVQYQTVLLATKAGNSVRIVSWPESLTLPEFVEYDFSLGTPSPFRITTRTEKPYHGYVVETPFLTQFFRQWNGAQIPETLTVMPVFKDKSLHGYMIAFGPAEARDRETLNAMEKAAKNLGELWPSGEAAKAS